MSASPASSSKRIKFESSPSPQLTDNHATLNDEHFDHDSDYCVICLQSYADRTVIPTCSHEFCFECISLWAEQSQKCPLCSQLIGEYLIHQIRSQFDYQKHHLPPPRSKSPQLLPTGETHVHAARRARRERYWGRRERHDADEADELEQAIAKRRWVYQNHFYAKHVASNSFTRYRPYPTPAQFAASPDMISRATIFLRRELRVWPNLDVEFLTTFTISLMKSIDIRAESAVKLLSEFLDLDAPYIEGQRHLNAEHFAHEIYCYIRSGRDLSTYDNLVQYDTSSDHPPPYEQERKNRWRYGSQSRSRSPHHRRWRSRSRSRSPLSRVSSSALRAEYRRSPSTVHRRDSSSDDLSSDRIQRRRVRSVVSECEDVFDTSLNSHQSQPDDVQQHSVKKSERARGKERERDYTPPLLDRNEHYSSSASLRSASCKILPNGIIAPQPIARFHTFGDTTLSIPPVESVPENAVVPTASKRRTPAPDKDDADREPAASTSRKRPGTLRRPPRTLLESVQAHLSRNTVLRQAKDRTDEVAQLHLSQQHRDAGDPLPPCSNATTPLLGESSFAKEVDPVPNSPAEDTASRGIASLTYRLLSKGEDEAERIGTLSPPLVGDPEAQAAPCQKPNANSNLISSPHNANININRVDHTRLRHQDATIYTNDSENKAAVSSACAHSASDMRAVLLQRLREEQRVAGRDGSALHCSASPTHDAVNREEAEVLETRLRTRALLRVRLAAIKGIANESSMIEKP